MIRRILIALVVLCAWLGTALAQDQSKPAVFPQLGHSWPVLSIAFSPDGKVLASGSRDETVKLWDVASGRQLRTLSGHGSWVNSIAFSPDGKVLASGSGDKTIKLWDVASGRELRSLSGHTDWVFSVAFSPDGKVLASGSYDSTIKLWDVASGSELRTLSGHTDKVTSVAFSPDGKVLASGGEDKTIKLWDAASGRELRTLNGEPKRQEENSMAQVEGVTNWVHSVAFSPDGKVVASGSQDNTIKFWDVASGSELRTLLFHLGEYPGLALAHEDVEVEVPHGGRF